jgi:hypothetical protein
MTECESPNELVSLDTANDAQQMAREMIAAARVTVRFAIERLKVSAEDGVAMHTKNWGESARDKDVETVSWADLDRVVEAEGSYAFWEELKAHARHELDTGWRAARAMRDLDTHPLDRARFLALRAAFREELQPRGGVEATLIDQMVHAHGMYLFWLDMHTAALSREAWREDELRRSNQYAPPRLSDAEAQDRALQMVDRFQRAFLRVLRAFRDMRRYSGPVIVQGGQVNIGDQQVNVHREPPR